MNDYTIGWDAYYAGRGFDETETTEWQNGWLDAEYDDMQYNEGDYFDDYFSF